MERAQGQLIVIELPPLKGAKSATVHATIGKRVKFSLRTPDNDVAAARTGLVLNHLERLYDAIRQGPRPLSQKEIAAYSGEAYHLWWQKFEENPGPIAGWSAFKAFTRAAMEGRILSAPTVNPDILPNEVDAARSLFGDDLTAGIDTLPRSEDTTALEQRFGDVLSWVLTKHALIVDPITRKALLEAVGEAAHLAGFRLKRAAQRDYSPDPNEARFPPLPKSPAKGNGKTSITGILTDWWKEAQATGRKPSTYESYSNTVEGFVAFLGHDDATKVTPEHVVGFKDHRLSSINPRTRKPISAKTVKDSDLSALKTLFGWAVRNHRLPINPAIGITIKLGKRKVTRPKGFTDEEAKALLKAADEHQQGSERPKTFTAKRWIPWLCAYTGARVGEMAQLRKQDVRKIGDHWIIHLTPEAGTVKTNEARDVVLHEHLVAKGFPTFVQSSNDGHLFINPASDGDVLGPLQGLKNRLAEAARKTVPDPRVQPTHGWRHRFKTVARSVGIDSRIADAIQGHAARTDGDDYGDVTIEAMALTMAKFPRQLEADTARSNGRAGLRPRPKVQKRG